MEIDDASLQDIDVFSRDSGAASVFAMMNTCRTVRGARLLDAFLRNPLGNRKDILEVQESLSALGGFGDQEIWPFTKGHIEDAEKYLLSNILLIEPSSLGLAWVNRAYFSLRRPGLSEILHRHVDILLETLSLVARLPFELSRLLGLLHELDMLICLAGFNRRHGLVNPEILDEGEQLLYERGEAREGSGHARGQGPRLPAAFRRDLQGDEREGRFRSRTGSRKESRRNGWECAYWNSRAFSICSRPWALSGLSGPQSW